ncbi:hypothetical protein LCGC14_2142430, partial [marine sediment metagenome]
ENQLIVAFAADITATGTLAVNPTIAFSLSAGLVDGNAPAEPFANRRHIAPFIQNTIS